MRTTGKRDRGGSQKKRQKKEKGGEEKPKNMALGREKEVATNCKKDKGSSRRNG